MSKFLNVPGGDYTIKVQDEGTITLDTGVEVGEVRITGDLIVEGDTTTVESENLVVKDNIITVNDGDTGTNGITLRYAGLEILRGSNTDQYPTQYFTFDEQISWNDPVTQTNKTGAFTIGSGTSVTALSTNTIVTTGTDFHLDFSSGSGVAKVVNTASYEDRVVADNDIPNKKYVDDSIVAGIQSITIKSIQQGDSKVELFDDSIEAVESNFNVEINGTEVAVFKENIVQINETVFQGNSITNATSGEDLVLRSFSGGSVSVDGVLKLPNQETDPDASTGIIIYGKDPSYGNTGLFYVNSDNTSDEVISTNRALLYSMLF